DINLFVGTLQLAKVPNGCGYVPLTARHTAASPKGPSGGPAQQDIGHHADVTRLPPFPFYLYLKC
uniref:Uncharacterized protein n=1 Tax=Aegilops tauschii subsp. strangulata TaxID=200361 RepID=A0A453IKP8_AEGTS